MTSTLCENHKNILIKAGRDTTVLVNFLGLAGDTMMPVDLLGLAAGVGPTKTDTTMPGGIKEVDATMLSETKNVNTEVIITRQDTIMTNIPMLTRTKKVDAGVIIDAARAAVDPTATVVRKLVDDSVDLMVRKLVDDSVDPVMRKLVDDFELGQDNLSEGK